MLKLLILLLFTLPGLAEESVTDAITGFRFPRQITVESDGKTYRLNATGVATRKAFVVNVFSVVHYLEEGGTEQDLLEDGKAKQVTLKYKLNIPSDKIVPGVSKSLLSATCQADCDAVQNELQEYAQFYNQDITKGDEQVVQWLPGGVINVYINGQKRGSITSIPFAKVVWSQFVGPHGEVPREKLLTLMQGTYENN